MRERRWRPYTGWVSVAFQSLTAIGAGHILSRSAVAQSVERSAVNRLVVGSNPTRGANSFKVRDSGLFCAWSCSAAFRRVWRNGPGDSGLFCAWSCSAALWRVWRRGTGRFRLVLCMELVRRVVACVAEGDGAIPARFVHGVVPPRSGVCGGRGRGDLGSFCAWSRSAAFRRLLRKGPGRFRLVLCMELVCRVPACVAERAGAIPARFVHGVAPPRCGVCGGRGRGDSGLFCAWSCSAALWRVWRKGPGRYRLVLCMELLRRVVACVAEGAGAVPACFVHGVGPPRSGVCGGTGRAISARFVHGVAPPRCGVCGGRGRGDLGLFCARSWSAAFRRLWRNGPGDLGLFCAWSCSAALWRVWRNGPGRYRLVLCMELVCRVPAFVSEGDGRFRLVLCMELLRRVVACVAVGAGAISACFVLGVGPPRSGVCGGTGRAISACFVHGVGLPRSGVCGGTGGRGDIGLFCAWSWFAAFRRLWRRGTGRFHFKLANPLDCRVVACPLGAFGVLRY